MQKDELALTLCQINFHFGFWQVLFFSYYSFSNQMKVFELNGNIQKLYLTTMT